MSEEKKRKKHWTEKIDDSIWLQMLFAAVMVGGAGLFLTVTLSWAYKPERDAKRQRYEACLADKKPEYYCWGLIYGGYRRSVP